MPLQRNRLDEERTSQAYAQLLAVLGSGQPIHCGLIMEWEETLEGRLRQLMGEAGGPGSFFHSAGYDTQLIDEAEATPTPDDAKRVPPGFALRKVSGAGGDCLPLCFVHASLGAVGSEAEVRGIVAGWALENPERLEPTLIAHNERTGDCLGLEAYAERLRQPGVWLGESALVALSESLRVDVHVYAFPPNDDAFTCTRVESGMSGGVLSLRFMGQHYDLLLPSVAAQIFHDDKLTWARKRYLKQTRVVINTIHELSRALAVATGPGGPVYQNDPACHALWHCLGRELRDEVKEQGGLISFCARNGVCTRLRVGDRPPHIPAHLPRHSRAPGAAAAAAYESRLTQPLRPPRPTKMELPRESTEPPTMRRHCGYCDSVEHLADVCDKVPEQVRRKKSVATPAKPVYAARKASRRQPLVGRQPLGLDPACLTCASKTHKTRDCDLHPRHYIKKEEELLKQAAEERPGDVKDLSVEKLSLDAMDMDDSPANSAGSAKQSDGDDNKTAESSASVAVVSGSVVAAAEMAVTGGQTPPKGSPSSTPPSPSRSYTPALISLHSPNTHPSPKSPAPSAKPGKARKMILLLRDTEDPSGGLVALLMEMPAGVEAYQEEAAVAFLLEGLVGSVDRVMHVKPLMERNCGDTLVFLVHAGHLRYLRQLIDQQHEADAADADEAQRLSAGADVVEVPTHGGHWPTVRVQHIRADISNAAFRAALQTEANADVMGAITYFAVPNTPFRTATVQLRDMASAKRILRYNAQLPNRGWNATIVDNPFDAELANLNQIAATVNLRVDPNTASKISSNKKISIDLRPSSTTGPKPTLPPKSFTEPVRKNSSTDTVRKVIGKVLGQIRAYLTGPAPPASPGSPTRSPSPPPPSPPALPFHPLNKKAGGTLLRLESATRNRTSQGLAAARVPLADSAEILQIIADFEQDKKISQKNARRFRELAVDPRVGRAALGTEEVEALDLLLGSIADVEAYSLYTLLLDRFPSPGVARLVGVAHARLVAQGLLPGAGVVIPVDSVRGLSLPDGTDIGALTDESMDAIEAARQEADSRLEATGNMDQSSMIASLVADLPQTLIWDADHSEADQLELALDVAAVSGDPRMDYVPPFIHNPPVDETQALGAVVQYDLRLSGHPPPRLVVTLNGRDLSPRLPMSPDVVRPVWLPAPPATPDFRTGVVIEDRASEQAGMWALRLEGVTAEMAGVYQLSAENVAGVYQASFTLSVPGAATVPPPPMRPLAPYPAFLASNHPLIRLLIGWGWLSGEAATTNTCPNDNFAQIIATFEFGHQGYLRSFDYLFPRFLGKLTELLYGGANDAATTICAFRLYLQRLIQPLTDSMLPVDSEVPQNEVHAMACGSDVVAEKVTLWAYYDEFARRMEAKERPLFRLIVAIRCDGCGRCGSHPFELFFNYTGAGSLAGQPRVAGRGCRSETGEPLFCLFCSGQQLYQLYLDSQGGVRPWIRVPIYSDADTTSVEAIWDILTTAPRFFSVRHIAYELGGVIFQGQNHFTAVLIFEGAAGRELWYYDGKGRETSLNTYDYDMDPNKRLQRATKDNIGALINKRTIAEFVYLPTSTTSTELFPGGPAVPAAPQLTGPFFDSTTPQLDPPPSAVAGPSSGGVFVDPVTGQAAEHLERPPNRLAFPMDDEELRRRNELAERSSRSGVATFNLTLGSAAVYVDLDGEDGACFYLASPLQDQRRRFTLRNMSEIHDAFVTVELDVADSSGWILNLAGLNIASSINVGLLEIRPGDMLQMVIRRRPRPAAHRPEYLAIHYRLTTKGIGFTNPSNRRPLVEGDLDVVTIRRRIVYSAQPLAAAAAPRSPSAPSPTSPSASNPTVAATPTPPQPAGLPSLVLAPPHGVTKLAPSSTMLQKHVNEKAALKKALTSRGSLMTSLDFLRKGTYNAAAQPRGPADIGLASRLRVAVINLFDVDAEAIGIASNYGMHPGAGIQGEFLRRDNGDPNVPREAYQNRFVTAHVPVIGTKKGAKGTKGAPIRLRPGGVVVTPLHRLPQRIALNVLAPEAGDSHRRAHTVNAARNAVNAAAQAGLTSVVLPPWGTGIFASNDPLTRSQHRIEALQDTLNGLRDALLEHPQMEVVLAFYNPGSTDAATKHLELLRDRTCLPTFFPIQEAASSGRLASVLPGRLGVWAGAVDEQFFVGLVSSVNTGLVWVAATSDPRLTLTYNNGIVLRGSWNTFRAQAQMLPAGVYRIRLQVTAVPAQEDGTARLALLLDANWRRAHAVFDMDVVVDVQNPPPDPAQPGPSAKRPRRS